MKTSDWIVVGSGITGAALSYELRKAGFSVLLLDEHRELKGATRLSYGGLAYWSGTTELTRKLCQEGWQRYQVLSQELETDIQFREVDLLLTVRQNIDPQTLVSRYNQFATPPRLISVEEACEREPLLNPDAISGVFTVRHGHVSPELLNGAYCQGFTRLGGVQEVGKVWGFLQEGDRIFGVKTDQEIYHSNNVVICAGGWSRHLLKKAGISLRLHFTHSAILETPPLPMQLKTIVMSAAMERFQLEAQSTQPELESLWDEFNSELAPSIMDASAVQLLDGRIRIGQPSYTLSNPDFKLDPVQSEGKIRTAIAQILPTLEHLSATWHPCLVAFSPDSLPLVGRISGVEGLSIFSGFSNPLVFVPPLAQRFAHSLGGQTDEAIKQLSPERFSCY